MKKRSLYSMYHNIATLGQVGRLTPVLIQEVAPGDTWSGNSGLLLRFSPLNHALVQDLFIDVFYFYVPHRLVYANWEDFWAEGPIDSPTYTLPSVSVAAGSTNYQSLFWEAHSSEAHNFGAFRLYAYNLIWNEFFRNDEDSVVSASAAPGPYGLTCSFKSDYWTELQENLGRNQDEFFFDTNVGSGTQASAVDVLNAIARQKIEFRKNTYGTRYVDQLRQMGINVNYQMLQRPEVVAIHRTMVNITDVVATDGANLGDLAGHAINGSSIRMKRRTFPEHGTLMGLMLIRPKPMDKLQCDWFDLARDYSSYYDPGQEFLPPTEVQRRDVYPGATTANATDEVGYWPWGDWYRKAVSKIHATLDDGYWAFPVQLTENGPANAESLSKMVTTNNMFSDTTYAHFQAAVSHRLKALRLIGKQKVGTSTAVGGGR